MSFANSLKEKLCAASGSDGAPVCCGLLFSHAGRKKNYLLRTEIAGVIEILEQTYEHTAGRPLPVTVRHSSEFGRTYRLTVARHGADPTAFSRRRATRESLTAGFREPQEQSRLAILAALGGWSEYDGSITLAERFFAEPEQGNAFLRGLFIANGVVSDPGRDYHLEFCGLTKPQADETARLLSALDFRPSISSRGERWTVYFKNGEQIEYLLAAIGGLDEMFEMGNIRIGKDISNNLNRQMNCDTANLAKSRDAAQKQIEAIRYIHRVKGAEYIPFELRATAQARLENDDASLAELGKILGVGRSGVNHRMTKILAIYEELKKKEGGE